MFKFNGNNFTLKEVETAAADSNMNIDSYISEVGIIEDEVDPKKKKKKDPKNKKLDNSKEAILRRRRERLTQKSSDPLDYDNYDIGSDSFILPVDLEEVVVTPRVESSILRSQKANEKLKEIRLNTKKPPKFSEPDYFGKKAAFDEENKEKGAIKVYDQQVKAISQISSSSYDAAAAAEYFKIEGRKLDPINPYRDIPGTLGTAPGTSTPTQHNVPVYESDEEYYKRLGKFDEFIAYTNEGILPNPQNAVLKKSWEEAKKNGSAQLEDDTLNNLNFNVDESLQPYVERVVNERQDYLTGEGIEANMENAAIALTVKYNAIESTKNQLDTRYKEIEKTIAPFISQNNIDIESIENLKKDFNFDPLDTESIKAIPSHRIVAQYNKYIESYNANQNKIKDLKFNNIIAQYTKSEVALDATIQQYNKDIKKYGTDAQIIKSLNYDYSNMNRLALNMEQFFAGNLAEIGSDIVDLANKGLQILGDYRGPYQLNKSIVDAVSGEEVIIKN